MRAAAALGAGLLLSAVVACSSAGPVAIRAGDIGAETRQPIGDVKLAAEIVPPGGGPALKFRSVSHMAHYLEDHADTPGTMFVTDYPTGHLIPVETAVFVKGQVDGGSKELDYFAFGQVKAAVAFGEKTGEAATDWPSIRERAEAGRD
jgi:hypothetical protein